MITVQGVGESSGIQVFTKDHGGFTPEEIAEYMAGYDYNEQYGDKKQWD